MPTKNGKTHVQAGFEQLFGRKAVSIFFAPYRICPLGAHTDHQLGKVTGFALDKGIYIAYEPATEGMIELNSLQFPQKAVWKLSETPPEKIGDWADYLRGAAIALARRYPLHVGMRAVIGGELPTGGLSSSAAVTICFLKVLSAINGLSLSSRDLTDISQEAENQYVGVRSGRLDQSCILLSRKTGLLYLDFLEDTHRIIETPSKMKPFALAVFFSGLERSLVSSGYNKRVDECKEAAWQLLGLAGFPQKEVSQTLLSDVPYEVFQTYKSKLPQNLALRAEHWFCECERVTKGIEAWANGDIEAFGKLVFESGYSSIYNYEAGSQELIRLYEIMQETDGIYGGRFSGAGFKGCCFALIDPEKKDTIFEKVRSEYLAAFSALKDKYSACICHPADGVGDDRLL